MKEKIFSSPRRRRPPAHPAWQRGSRGGWNRRRRRRRRGACAETEEEKGSRCSKRRRRLFVEAAVVGIDSSGPMPPVLLRVLLAEALLSRPAMMMMTRSTASSLSKYVSREREREREKKKRERGNESADEEERETAKKSVLRLSFTLFHRRQSESFEISSSFRPPPPEYLSFFAFFLSPQCLRLGGLETRTSKRAQAKTRTTGREGRKTPLLDQGFNWPAFRRPRPQPRQRPRPLLPKAEESRRTSSPASGRPAGPGFTT